jgi:CRP-like cAMP-binding protein
LAPKDKELLTSLERGPESFTRDRILWRQGAASDYFYTVSNGWAFSYRDMPNGKRQVLDIYVPGDIIGLREFAFDKRITNLMTLTEAELCAFPKTRLPEVFSSSTLLCSIFFMISARDQSILLERLVNLGRRSAREKLAHFLVELSNRLEKTNAAVANHLELPLGQRLLADALGLTTVHVSRTFQEMKEEGLISIANAEIMLLDIAGLRQIGGFEPDYLEADLGSFLRQIPHR